MADKFGELRSIAQRGATPQTWGDMLNRAHQLHNSDGLTPGMLAYLRGWASQFPNELRVVPRGWTRKLLAGADAPVFSLCRELHIRKAHMDARVGSTLRAYETLKELQTLRLNLCHLDYLGVMGLVQAPWFQGLHTLALHECELSRAAWDTLAHQMPPHLKRLEVHRCALPSDHWEAALGSVRLEELVLQHNVRDPEPGGGLAALQTQRLKRLEMSGVRMRPEELCKLLAAPLHELTSLRLTRLKHGTFEHPIWVPTEAFHTLWNNPTLERVTHLEFSKMHIGKGTFSLSSTSPLRPESLHLGDTSWDEPGVLAALGEHVGLATVRTLHVGHVGREQALGLLRRGDWRALESLHAPGVHLEESMLRDGSRFPALREVNSASFWM